MSASVNRTRERLLLLALLLVGACFRIYHLDYSSWRGDTIHFWRICHTDITGWGIVTQWEKLGVGQLPLPLAVTKFIIDVFRLPVTEFTIRLPNALFGLALVPVLFAIGRRLGGVAVGAVAGLLMAVNPFHIQMSIEAYFYTSLMLGGGLVILALLDAFQAHQYDRPLSRGFLTWCGAGFLLIAYSQVTGWGALAVFVLAVLWPLWKRWKAGGPHRQDLWKAVAVFAVMGAPLLFIPWGLPHLLSKLTSPEKAAGQAVVEMAGQTAGGMFVDTLSSFAWGATLPRMAFTLGVLALSLAVVWKRRREQKELLLFPVLWLVVFGVFFVSRNLIGAAYESRYVGALQPMYLALLALGLVRGPDLLLGARVGPRARQALSVALVLAGLGLALPPAIACTRLGGLPAPYKDIIKAVDSNLRPGTPVLVDRWFESWNELLPYPSSNAVFTFTVPNEPLEQFLRVQWRTGAQQFFTRHPDAAYLELAKTYWEIPTVGAWAWPRQFFARHVTISNEAGLYLRELGLAARGDYYSSTTNRLVVELFYNTREDIMRRMQQTGTKLLPWYGKGWRFEKSGPMGMFRVQTQDFRDWRVLEENAELELINLSTQAVPVHVNMRAVAIGGAKTVQLTPEIKHSFPPSQVTGWRFGPLVLQPGINIVPLNDPLWRLSQNPLLVDRIAMEEVPAGTDLSTAIAPRRAGE
jgi:hypothetical protein